MLDKTTNRGKIIDAAFRLTAKDGWTGLSLDRIANEARVSLNELRAEFSSKAEILAAYTRAVDNAVLAKVDPADAGAAPRDRLFDVLMTRFELMAPEKATLRRIRQDLRYRLSDSAAQFGPASRSLYWMLAASGIDAEGSRGLLRVPALMSLYVRVFDIWLEDDDPGLARTMAALDSRLRRGERAMQRMDDLGATAVRFCARILPSRSAGGKAEPPQPEEPVEPASEPTSSGQANGSAGPGPATAV